MLQEFLRDEEWMEMPILSFASNKPLRSAVLPVVDPELVDWATIELGGEHGKVSVGEMKNALNRITNGSLSEASINKIQARAIEALTTPVTTYADGLKREKSGTPDRFKSQ